MKKTAWAVLALALLLTGAGCQSVSALEPQDSRRCGGVSERENQEGDRKTEKGNPDGALRLTVNDTELGVEWEENASVEALTELVSSAPLTVQMSMYGGFEQVGSLGAALPRNDRQMTAEAGDIVLYSGDRIVVFYGANSWAYTRLGKIGDRSAEEMEELLGKGDVTLSLSWE